MLVCFCSWNQILNFPLSPHMSRLLLSQICTLGTLVVTWISLWPDSSVCGPHCLGTVPLPPSLLPDSAPESVFDCSLVLLLLLSLNHVTTSYSAVRKNNAFAEKIVRKMAFWVSSADMSGQCGLKWTSHRWFAGADKAEQVKQGLLEDAACSKATGPSGSCFWIRSWFL